MTWLQSGTPDSGGTNTRVLSVPAGVTTAHTVLVIISGTTPGPSSVGCTASAVGAVVTPLVPNSTATNMFHASWKVTGVKAGDTITTTTPGQSSFASTHHYFDNDFGIVGAIGTRGGVSQAFQVAPALAVPAGSKVTLVSLERTIANGTAVSSVVNSNGRAATTRSYFEATTFGVTSTLIAEFDEPTTSTGTTTVTYSGASSNGAAYHLLETVKAPSPPATPPPFTGTPSLTLWDGTKEVPALLSIWDGTTEVPVANWYSYEITTLDTLLARKPYFVAHRGGSNSWPEGTRYAYRKAAAWPMHALEVSCFRSSDGVWVSSHDASTLRVTGVDYTIASTPWATLAPLTVTAASTNTPAQARQPLSKVVDILDDFAHDHVIFIEDKSYANADSLLDLMDAYGGPSRFVWKTYGPGGLTGTNKAKARGYKTWAYYFNGTDMTNLTTSYVNYDYLGIDFACSDAAITAAVAYGKPVIGHILTTAAQRDRMLSLGCVGAMCADIQAVVPPQR